MDVDLQPARDRFFPQSIREKCNEYCDWPLMKCHALPRAGFRNGKLPPAVQPPGGRSQDHGPRPAEISHRMPENDTFSMARNRGSTNRRIGRGIVHPIFCNHHANKERGRRSIPRERFDATFQKRPTPICFHYKTGIRSFTLPAWRVGMTGTSIFRPCGIKRIPTRSNFRKVGTLMSMPTFPLDRSITANRTSAPGRSPSRPASPVGPGSSSRRRTRR